MKIQIIFLLAVVVMSSALQMPPKYNQLENYTFDQYLVHFEKKITQEEYESRKAIFVQNLELIKNHNNLPGQTFKKGINQFTDMSFEETQQYLGLNKGHRGAIKKSAIRFLDNIAENPFSQTSKRGKLPKSFDWRQKGAVTAVKNQGKCGSCWAFASTETIESHAAINSNKLLTLSPQQLTSCSSNTLKCGGTGGCSGSIAEVAFNYVQLFRMTTEKEYPYTSGTTQKSGECFTNITQNAPAVEINGYWKLPINDQQALMETLVHSGPVAISVDATVWHSYESGIFNGCPYDKSIVLNHAVQLVGYGSSDEGDYWIVRNSWGPTWGEDGFIRLKRENISKCGVDESPLSGAACVNDGQEIQTVCGTCGMLSDSVIPLGVKVL